DGFEHRDLSHGMLARRFPVSAIRVCFNHYQDSNDTLSLADVSGKRIRVSPAISLFDVIVYVETGDSPIVRASFNKDVFDASTVQRVLRNYVSLLRALARAPSEKVRAAYLIEGP